MVAGNPMADQLHKNQIWILFSKKCAQSRDLAGAPAEQNLAPLFQHIFDFPIAIPHIALGILGAHHPQNIFLGIGKDVLDMKLVIKHCAAYISAIAEHLVGKLIKNTARAAAHPHRVILAFGCKGYRIPLIRLSFVPQNWTSLFTLVAMNANVFIDLRISKIQMDLVQADRIYRTSIYASAADRAFLNRNLINHLSTSLSTSSIYAFAWSISSSRRRFTCVQSVWSGTFTVSVTIWSDRPSKAVKSRIRVLIFSVRSTTANSLSNITENAVAWKELDRTKSAPCTNPRKFSGPQSEKQRSAYGILNTE